MSPETTKRIRSAWRATSRARASRTSPPTSSMPGVSTTTSLAPSRPGRSGDVVLPALGGPGDGRAVGRADLEDVLAHEGVQHRRLAPADHAERGDLDRRLVELFAQLAQLGELAGQDGFFLGSQLEARQGGFEAFPGALDGRVVFGGVRLELVEQFFELVHRPWDEPFTAARFGSLVRTTGQFAEVLHHRMSQPTSWTATGKPSGANPIGNETVGRPV